MMCLTPSAVKNKDGKYVPVPCGSCAECLEKRRLDWFIRLREHAKNYRKLSFVTLSYSEDYVPILEIDYKGDPWFAYTLDKRDVQLFLKRLRERLERRKISYYIVGEYGTHTKRPHYHALFFGVDAEDRKILEQSWDFGIVHIGNLNDASLNYVCKYHLNPGASPECVQKSFALCSKGIGKSFIEKNKDIISKNPHVRMFYRLNGYKKPLPRYFRDRILNDVQKVDHGIRCQKRMEKKMSNETKNEFKKNYWINKRSQIEQKNINFKRKSEESGTL